MGIDIRGDTGVLTRPIELRGHLTGSTGPDRINPAKSPKAKRLADVYWKPLCIIVRVQLSLPSPYLKILACSKLFLASVDFEEASAPLRRYLCPLLLSPPPPPPGDRRNISLLTFILKRYQ